MKNIALILAAFLIVFLISCGDRKQDIHLLKQAETLLKSDPDSALLLLDSIQEPLDLTTKNLARWSMLVSEIRDKKDEQMLSDTILSEALAYWKRHGTPLEKSRMALFLGRSYFEVDQYEKALEQYTYALEVADEAKKYNLAGYICTYMADVYDTQDLMEKLKEKYREAIRYFSLAGNKRSMAIAYNNLGFVFIQNEEYDKALEYCNRADSITAFLNDSIVKGAIYNYKGIIYTTIKEYKLAEHYTLKSLKYFSEDEPGAYYLLSRIYLERGEVEKAKEIFEYYKTLDTDRKDNSGRYYWEYLFNKKQQNWEKALAEFEKYQAIVDSIEVQKDEEAILRVERKYQYSKVLNENQQLKIRSLWVTLLLFLVVSICLFLGIVYLHSRKQKLQIKQDLDNYRIQLLNKELELQKKVTFFKKNIIELEKEKEILLKERLSLEKDENSTIVPNEKDIINKYQKEVQELKQEISGMRFQLLKTSVIAKKLNKLSEKPVINQTSSLISPKDWSTLKKEVADIYHNYEERIKEKVPALTSEDIDFCMLSLFDIDSKGLACLLNYNTDSVHKKRSRLKSKLGIPKECDLDTFIRSI